MKVIHKPTANLASLRSMITAIKSGIYATYQVEQLADAKQVSREMETFIGKDLKPVTVVLIKRF